MFSVINKTNVVGRPIWYLWDIECTYIEYNYHSFQILWHVEREEVVVNFL